MPYRVVTPKQMQEFDNYAIKKLRIDGIILMENAARATVDALLKAVPNAQNVLIVCGTGNNGGDGLAIYRQLEMRGIQTKALILGDADKLTGDARKNYDILRSFSANMKSVSTEAEFYKEADGIYDVIVDAIFGTGLARAVTGIYEYAVNYINGSGSFICSVDIPSGIDGLSGKVMGAAVKAELTVTFQYKKWGHILMPGRLHSGDVVVAPIAPYVFSDQSAWALTYGDMTAMLPKRCPDSNKGTYGCALLVGGSPGYFGAPVMAAHAALRLGCGLMKVATICDPGAFATLPESMVHIMGPSWDETDMDKLEALLAKTTAIAVGPGAGVSSAMGDIIDLLVDYDLPTVIDADGLNTLAKRETIQLREDIILTPHPGEMARLIKCDIQAVLSDPVCAAKRAAEAFGCVVLLKGATSVIASPGGELMFNVTGNAALAKGGSGDVLTGIILSLLAQGMTSYDAACLGSFILGTAAERVTKNLAERCVMARDVIAELENILA